jgi:translocation and assembly module TamB
MSGGGALSVDGRMSLPGAPLDARLDIDGDAFQVVDNDDARVFLSPDLRVEANADRLRVTGAVHVPRAELTPGEQAPSAVTVSEDQVLLSEEPPTAAAAERDLSAEIEVSLGDEVYFDGLGLTARIEGDLVVEQEPRTPTTATGELRILDGEYRAYGQGLVIDSGRIYFAGGPVTQPALDVRAVRRPREGILVGANVQGTLESPSFELFSEPTMTQQEQLSWLVLGRSLEETPDGQENALSQAALAMGLKGGDFLAKNIGERVGFDQLGIETGSGEAGAPSDPSDAALVVGKYLSPKLYVSYGIGLFTPESVLEMQYEITRNWTIVTQSSGDSTGGDVLYTVEFGK